MAHFIAHYGFSSTKKRDKGEDKVQLYPSPSFAGDVSSACARAPAILSFLVVAKSKRREWVRSPQNIFQLRVALRYIKPPIWRRILVPDNLLLGDLHPLLVCVMRWGGYHMHAFRFGGGFNPIEYSTHDMVMECGPRVLDEDSVSLNQLIRRKGQTFSYEYDFGDSWQHEIKVEKILPYDPAVALPVCLAGERACPPEDCGSFPGYANILRVLAKAETDGDRELLEWLGPYDPEEFDLEEVNRRLQPRRAGKSK
jgi:hypothetical protein